MKFDEIKEKLHVIHKLHTARDSDGETIFYKKPYTANKLIVVSKGYHVFELDKITLMSLSKRGLLIQYKPVDKNITNVFTSNMIEDIIVEKE